MQYCSVKDCLNKESYIVRLHSFPKDEVWRVKWIQFTGRGEQWVPTRSSVISSEHFELKYIQGRKLMRNAIIPCVETRQSLHRVEVSGEY